MMSKKGFQASVNMLVVIILGIIIIGVGLSITIGLFNNSGKFVEIVGAQKAGELAKIAFADGQQVATVNPKISIHRRESATFTVGVRNIHDERTFYLNVVPHTGLSKNYEGNPISASEATKFMIPKIDPNTIHLCNTK